MIGVGTRAGRWTTIRPLGEGGSGSVWLGEDPLGEQAALKFYPRLQASRSEFRREAAAALHKHHPNLLRLVDAGMLDDHTPWLALGFVNAPDLRTTLERGSLTPRQAVALGMEVFAALDALHRGGFAHGDVKPENVLYDGLVRLVDFGRARLHHLYGDGAVFPGTPPYMHPSLFRGGSPTPSTDCFATWVMLQECFAGARPFSAAQLSGGQPLPAYQPLGNEELDPLIEAGITGRLSDARVSWLALARYGLGRRDLPVPPPRPAELPPAFLERVLGAARGGAHVTLVGDPEIAGRVLGWLHRRWVMEGGTVLWTRAGWGAPDAPLSGVLALASHAAEGLEEADLARVEAELGPLGGHLLAASPATRAWLRAGDVEARTATQLHLALVTFLAACPRPLLVIAEGLDRIDGSSRRLLAGLALRDVVVVGSAEPDAPHGLSREVTLPPAPSPTVVALDPAGADLHRRATTLGLPYGRHLATAAALTEEAVAAHALDAEAAGAARWTGAELVARSTEPASPAEAQRDAQEAAARLDPAQDPLLVARFASIGQDQERLATVLEAAVEEALRLDPSVALALLLADRSLQSAPGLLRAFHVAVVARDMNVAADLLGRVQRAAGVLDADRFEVEAEFAFRTGQIVPAVAAYRRVAACLGRPLHLGVRGFVQDVVAALRVWRGRPSSPRPDPRLARVFERLHDLHFTHDHGPMLRLHALWQEAAPGSIRVRAMDIVWRAALGRGADAGMRYDALWSEISEHTDPTGAAVVLLHRGIARSWTGDVADAHVDALAAAERLLGAGDPYLAALAVGTLAVCAFHLGDPGPLARVSDRLAELVHRTGDSRAGGWVTASEAQIAWMEGAVDEALKRARVWVDEAEAREESTTVLARRFLAELLLEKGAFAEASALLLHAWADRRRFRMQMDFTDAVAIDLLIADAQARLARAAGLRGVWRYRQVLALLVRRSPRWRARVTVALAWQATARGDRIAGERTFEEAHTTALSAGLPGDAWWALHHAALALGGADRKERATLFARARGLRRPLSRAPHAPD